MRITCVIGPYFPIPPVLGGAVERIFLGLAVEFARRGHAVTMISRRYPGFADEETVGGVHHLRLRSCNAPTSRFAYRFFDLLYALRVCSRLPESDVTITHSVALPLMIPKRRAGKVVVSVGRFPKGQMGLYHRASRLQAVSSHVARAIAEQSPSVASLVKVIPNSLPVSFCEQLDRPRCVREKQILFVGRIAREKGIGLLIRAFALIASQHPDWRLVIVGPHQHAQGGDGSAFLEELKRLSSGVLNRVEFVGPVFDETALIARLLRAEIFVYPSLALLGESFGMAPLEAMACGCAVVTSSLACFLDFLRPGVNGLLFDHTDGSGRALADELDRLIRSPDQRLGLVEQAVSTCRLFTPARVADSFLEDFARLTSSLIDRTQAERRPA